MQVVIYSNWPSNKFPEKVLLFVVLCYIFSDFTEGNVNYDNLVLAKALSNMSFGRL